MPETEIQPKVIKRYTNRKLYDTVESRYVTLEEIAEMLRAGDDVQIIDNKTKEDLTNVTLAQIIFEQEKKQTRMPLSMLRDLVRDGGGTLQGFISREIQPRVATLREEAEVRVATLREEAETRTRKLFHRDEQKSPAELLASMKTSLDEWQQRLSQGGFTDVQKELGALRTRLDDLKKMVERRQGGDDKNTDA